MEISLHIDKGTDPNYPYTLYLRWKGVEKVHALSDTTLLPAALDLVPYMVATIKESNDE